MFRYVALDRVFRRIIRCAKFEGITDLMPTSLSGEFDSLYSAPGRPSIAPEYVLRALLLQAFVRFR